MVQMGTLIIGVCFIIVAGLSTCTASYNEKNMFATYSLVLFLGSLLLIACSNSEEAVGFDPQTVPSSDNSIEVQPIISHHISASSVEELVDEAELIIIGRAEKTDQIVNTARDPHSPTQPDSRLFGVGQIYNIHVEQYLQGDGPEFIQLIQSEGLITPEMPAEEQTIEIAREQSDHIPLSTEKRYIMFLRQVWEFPDQEYYVGILQPWRFVISDTMEVEPESQWHYAELTFPTIELSQFLEKIEVQKLPINE